MASSNGSSLGFREQYILASAFFHAIPPQDVHYANCARVLRQAMFAAGQWEPDLSAALYDAEGFPEFALWYSALIDMAFHEPESERLLNGGGNLGTIAGREAMRLQSPRFDEAPDFGFPAGAHFTGCWLSPAGKRVAEQLLTLHPDWEELLTTKVS
ncbi:MAG: hypothetical protein AABZ08_11625 [Planctomycetota bacterium]